MKWSERLMEVGKDGVTILKVWAMDIPGADLVHIANIVLKSDLVTSMFGDERLHF